jgi:hypothetical protein
MTLELTRADLLQLDPMSSMGTVALLPIGKKGRVKYATILDFTINEIKHFKLIFFLIKMYYRILAKDSYW